MFFRKHYSVQFKKRFIDLSESQVQDCPIKNHAIFLLNLNANIIVISGHIGHNLKKS